MRRSLFFLALLSVGVAGVAAAFAYPAIGARSSASATVTVKVTATDFKFKLSRSSVPVGTTVIFKVTNKGKIGHDFKINGKKTPLINPGQTKSVKVVFKKKGKLVFLCTVPGHARLGMTGKFGVGVTTGVTTTTPTTTTSGGPACTTPATTVNVSMLEYRFVLDKPSFPAGCTQFVVKNDGAEVHNFDLDGIHAGALLNPGGTETWSVTVPAGAHQYECDVAHHVEFGMLGSLTAT
ncbi:MAG: cupredoxin domain-containing protein [Gaiellaceae bacterium]